MTTEHILQQLNKYNANKKLTEFKPIQRTRIEFIFVPTTLWIYENSKYVIKGIAWLRKIVIIEEENIFGDYIMIAKLTQNDAVQYLLER